MSSHFPVTIAGRRFAGVSQLAAEMERRARNDILDHPGQAYPADHWRGLQDPRADEAVQDALAQLVGSEHPEVVQLVVHLVQRRDLLEVLLARLEGGAPGPLPRESRDLVGDELASRLCTDPALRARALAEFKSSGMQRHALRIVLNAGNARERVAGVALTAAAGKLDESLADFAGWSLAMNDGAEPLLAAGASLFTQPEPVRRAFLDGALRSDPSWGERPELARTLRLPV